jgi:hypothetical protein
MARSTSPLVVSCLGLAISAAGLAAAGCGEKERTLKVTGLDRDRGSIDGDTFVTIQGNGFLSSGPRAVKVYFGTQQGGFRQATVVRFASDSQLIIRTPGGKPNEVADVLVMFEPGGQLKIPAAFTFVDSVAPPTIDDLSTKRSATGK